MRVGVERYADVRVPQTLLYDLCTDALLNEHGSAGVAQIVQADLRQVVGFNEPFPFLGQRIRVIRCPVFLAYDETRS